MALRKINVLVVDDSILFRTTLSHRLSKDSSFEVVGVAVDALDAEEKIKRLKPDVVTLDVEMPKMNGIEFLKKLMPTCPVRVVVVTSLPLNAFEALSAGAVDFVRKPDVTIPGGLDSFIKDLSLKIKIASTAKVRVNTALHAVRNLTAGVMPTYSGKLAANNMILAIGASTGGTEAILQVVRDLPATTPGIVVVQHIPPTFSKMYAQRLNGICKMQVSEAVDGERVEPGKIVIAAGEYHLTLHRDAKGYYVHSKPGPRVNGHCPSVDVLFESVAKCAKRQAVGVILTGMGSDGAQGLKQMRDAGAYTIGQDEHSCVVYGMPMMAHKCGAVQRQMSLEAIGPEMIRYLNSL